MGFYLISAITLLLVPFAIAQSLLMLRRALLREKTQGIAESPRMKELEQNVAALTAEVERLQEAQRFMTRLLDDRASRRAPP